ncbi:hypothetical protein GOL41_26960 [Sinorhizobium medicae]|nr:hypothetical protein [Sinorhizobium medicae]
MSITVTSNSDGTITVKCGSDMVTVGVSASSNADASPGIPILWPPSGVTASIVAEGKARALVVPVPSANGLAQAIRDQHDLYANEQETTIFQFDVQGSEPLAVQELGKVLSDLGNPGWMGTQIRLTGDRHE